MDTHQRALLHRKYCFNSLLERISVGRFLPKLHIIGIELVRFWWPWSHFQGQHLHWHNFLSAQFLLHQWTESYLTRSVCMAELVSSDQLQIPEYQFPILLAEQFSSNCTMVHKTGPFMISLLWSQFVLHIVERGIKHQITYLTSCIYQWDYASTLLLLNTTCPVLANSVDPDQLASEEANWSGSALFVIKYVNFNQKPRSSNLIGWKLEVGLAS